MRILILSQYYAPEPVEKVEDLARGLARLGHQVQVLTGFPCYPQGQTYSGYRQRWVQEEVQDGVLVTRVPQLPDHSRSVFRRTLYYLSFAVSAATIGLWHVRPADIVWVYQSALPTGLSAAWISRLRRMGYVPDVVDLWPESVSASGMLSNRWVLAAIRLVARIVYGLAAHVIVVTDGFRRSLLRMGVPAEKVTVVHNWMPAGAYRPVAPDDDLARREELHGRFNVVFAGNMGPLQDLETVIEAAALLRDLPEVQFVLVGGGLESERLQTLAQRRGVANVRFIGRRSPEQMPALFAAAQALLVHLKPDPLSDVSIPSKTFAYMASGRPVLMAVRGEAARFVSEGGFGIAVNPADPEALAAGVRQLYHAPPAERERMGRAGETLYRTRHCSEVQVARVARLLQEAAGRGQRNAAPAAWIRRLTGAARPGGFSEDRSTSLRLSQRPWGSG
jgi:glycosyltransferase involved in cell wall biosynthesis